MPAQLPVTLVGTELQRLQSSDFLDPAVIFASGSNLRDLAALATDGIVVRDAADPSKFTTTVLTGTTTQILITNGDGLAGAPTVALANNVVLPGNGSATMPIGTTAQQPGAPVDGMIRYNTDTTSFEFRQSGAWISYATSAGGGGTVTSVGLVLPAGVFGVTGSPVTTTGTLTGSFIAQPQNSVFAGPVSGADATPTFRTLVPLDVTTGLGYTPVNKAGDSMSGPLDMGTNQIVGLGSPTGPAHATNKAYVDAVAQGLVVRQAVLAATTAPITATYDNGTAGVGATLTISGTSITIDGVLFDAIGEAVLFKDQTSTFQNGAYVVTSVAGPIVFTRREFTDVAAEIPSSFYFVQSGTVNTATGWAALVENPGSFTVGTDDITLAQFSSAGGVVVPGSGLSQAGTVLNVNVDGVTIEINGSDALQLVNGGVSNAKLTNSTITLAADTGTPDPVALGETLTLTGGTGIDTAVAANVVTVTLNATAADLSDVTVTTLTAGDLLVRNGGNTQFVNAAPGAASGVQAYDAALDGLAAITATAGVVVQTAANVFTTRSIAGTSGNITVANPTGAAADPTINLATVGTPGTYDSVTVDAFGRVTAGTAGGGGIPNTVPLTNAAVGTVSIGTPVYATSTADTFNTARANAFATKRVIGLVADATIASATSGSVVVGGPLTATTIQWDAITGQVGGLTSGSTYYLSPTTAGTLTATAPSVSGQYLAVVGTAVSPTTMILRVEPTILL